jgi:hypothetical protein
MLMIYRIQINAGGWFLSSLECARKLFNLTPQIDLLRFQRSNLAKGLAGSIGCILLLFLEIINIFLSVCFDLDKAGRELRVVLCLYAETR